MAKQQLKPKDKVVVRMTRDGAVEENLTAGTEKRVSGRPEDAELVKPVETDAPSEAISAEEQKKVQMRSQQRQFQAEHAEDSNTQPSSETSVTEEKKPEKPPQNVPETLPPPEAPFKPPVLELHGVSNEGSGSGTFWGGFSALFSSVTDVSEGGCVSLSSACSA